MSAPNNAPRDLKEALSSNRKADTTHVRRAFQIYTSRPCEYGDFKYQRANYRRFMGGSPHPVPTADDFKRFRAYLRAARDHIDEALDSMEMHLSTDYYLADVEGMKRAAYAVDVDTKPGDPHPPSYLPHVAPACASLMMAITQATDCGLLPRDPGRPWEDPRAYERLVVPGITFPATSEIAAPTSATPSTQHVEPTSESPDNGAAICCTARERSLGYADSCHLSECFAVAEVPDQKLSAIEILDEELEAGFGSGESVRGRSDIV